MRAYFITVQTHSRIPKRFFTFNSTPIKKQSSHSIYSFNYTQLTYQTRQYASNLPKSSKFGE